MWAGIGASPTFTIVIFNIIIVNVNLIGLVMIIFFKEGQFRIGMCGLSGCYLVFDHIILLSNSSINMSCWMISLHVSPWSKYCHHHFIILKLFDTFVIFSISHPATITVSLLMRTNIENFMEWRLKLLPQKARSSNFYQLSPVEVNKNTL